MKPSQIAHLAVFGDVYCFYFGLSRSSGRRQLFPRAAAIVHQGGIGTTAQALRAGRPMLIMRYSYDQPDNAARAERLGVARTINRANYTALQAAAELKYLLNEPKYTQTAADIGRQIHAENGVWAACDAIEARLMMPGAS